MEKKWNGKGFNGIDNIIYELKNGKGYIKEYYFNDKLKLKFEGDYLDNYKIKGKEYNGGKLEYEGEYAFNKKWNGIGYDKNSNLPSLPYSFPFPFLFPFKYSPSNIKPPK